jgi:hypothetical protein
MMAMRRIAIIALLVALVVSASFAATADDQVYFNTHTHKYHCLTCVWAKKCTSNCVKISREEAIRRGGVACKICGGSCSR